MITVPEATKTIIQRSRYLSEALSKNLINYSSLARYIKPELENMLGKKISNASVLMAIQRMSKDFQPKYSSEKIFKKPTSLTIHSNLVLITYSSNKLVFSPNDSQGFILITYGVNETTIVASAKLEEDIQKSLKKQAVKKRVDNIAAITIELPRKAIENPGSYYFFLKSLSWEGINVVELFTTTNELTLIVDEKDLKNTLGIIQSLFNELAK